MLRRNARDADRTEDWTDFSAFDDTCEAQGTDLASSEAETMAACVIALLSRG